MHDEQAARPSSTGWADLAERPADQASLAALATAVPGSLNGAQLVDAIAASEKALSLLTGIQTRLLAAFAVPFAAGDPMKLATRLARKNRDGDPSDDDVQMLVADAAVSLAGAEVAAALRISPVTAGIRVRDAETMTTKLAATLDALEQGQLDRGKVRVIAEQCEPLTEQHAAQVQGLVLPGAGELTTSELRDITGQAVITVDPDGAENRHQAAAARRELSLKALPDAMATLKAFLPADGAVKIFQISDLLATATAGTPDDPRGIGARRVDALVDIADHLLTHGYLDLSSVLGKPSPDVDDPGPSSAEAAPAASDARPARPSTSDQPSPADPALDPASSAASAQSADPAPSADPSSGPGPSADPGGPAASTESPNPAEPGVTTEPPAPTGSAPEPATPDRPISPNGSTLPFGPDPRPESKHGRDRAGRTLTRQGRRPHLSVTIGLGTLAGLDNLPGTLAGFGAIPATLARSIAQAAATITAQLTDPETGAITNAGSLIYRPRQDLRDQIAALLNVCQFPSCRQPVWRCEIDHRDPFDHQHPDRGGHTTAENTGPFCKRHHLFKHHTEWRLRPDPERHVLHWTSPTGHTYTKRRTQTVPPDVWFSSAGTTVAEQLDLAAAMTATPAMQDREVDTEAPGRGSRTATGGIEEYLRMLLLRNAINQRPMEYAHDATAWQTPKAGAANTGITDWYTSSHDRDDDPPPPF